MGDLLAGLRHLTRLSIFDAALPASQPFPRHVQHRSQEHSIDTLEALPEGVSGPLWLLPENMAVPAGPPRDFRVQQQAAVKTKETAIIRRVDGERS